MNDQTNNRPFFSISSKSISTEDSLPYDIYINSSKREGRNHFVKIISKGESLTGTYLEELEDKYLSFYIPESERSLFLETMVNSDHIEDVDKVDAIKDSAMIHLQTLFDGPRELSAKQLTEAMYSCHNSMDYLVNVLQDYDVFSLQKLISKLSLHDLYTYDHSVNVGMYCIAILKSLKLNILPKELVNCGLGGLLHDLGKIKISTGIINKMGELTDNEFSEIKRHPRFGLEILQETEIDCPEIDLEVLGRVIYEHHENFDGTGYPNRIKKNKIHFYARICTVADFFDALTTQRPYNKVLDVPKAIHVMSCTVGKRIDPFVFKIFYHMMKKFMQEDQLTFELDQSFDSERPFEMLPLVPIKDPQPSKEFGKIIVMDHDTKIRGKKCPDVANTTTKKKAAS